MSCYRKAEGLSLDLPVRPQFGAEKRKGAKSRSAALDVLERDAGYDFIASRIRPVNPLSGAWEPFR